ncbi:hypothetical protein [Neptuniibacter sp. QD37_11]|uniref:hypothetical protein n=1 Tax=Neptuniibacter sp. QD37_11 TaxID=3398209 RepID=UPI0039F47A5A
MNRTLDEKFCHTLSDNVEGFSEFSYEEQRTTAHLVQHNLTCDQFKHSSYPDCFYASHAFLNKVYGRTKFEEKMKSLKPQLISVEHGYDVSGRETKAYKLTDEAQMLFEMYLDKIIEEGAAPIELTSGKRLRKGRANAVASKDHHGFAVKSSIKIPSWQTINIPALFQYKDLLNNDLIFAKNNQNIPYLKQEYGEKFLSKIQRCLYQVIQLIAYAQAGFHLGQLYLRYDEADGGRLYGKGLHLQNVSKIVRNAALAECYDYDIENCHFSLMYQLASKQGEECLGIKSYMDNKRLYRERIASDLDLSIDKVKTCLIAIMYGATRSRRNQDAIPSEIGLHKAKQFYRHPIVERLFYDITKARKVIIGACAKSNGRYKNAMGKFIAGTEQHSKVLAHIMQGLEAKILTIVAGIYPDQIVLLQHDGWVTKAEIDTQIIVDTVVKELDINIQITEQMIESRSYEDMKEVSN